MERAKQRTIVRLVECLGALASIASIVWLVDERFGSDAKALAIIRKMGSKYTECQTFRDRVDISTEHRVNGKLDETKHYVVSINFRKPASLRYEVNEIVQSNPVLVSLACAHDKKGIITSGGLDSPVEREEGWLMDTYEIRDGKAQGALDGEARFGAFDLIVVPEPFGLIMPGYQALKYTDIDDYRLRGTETIDSRECFVLITRRLHQTIWIDKTSYAIRQVTEDSTSRDFSSVNIQHFHPTFDEPIGAVAFHLDANQLAVAKHNP